MQFKSCDNIRSQKGSYVLEFSLVLTIVIALIFGIILFGWLFNNYLTVAYAASRGARFIEMSRGYVPSPCSGIMNEILTNSPTLVPANLSVDIKLGTVSAGTINLTQVYPVFTLGTNKCSSSSYDTSMASALGSITQGSIYQVGTVTVTYTFKNILTGLNLAKLNTIVPVLSSTTPFIIE
jgi:Flp pilus assembly protein TadG